jgi:hypothetical protein
MLRPIESESAMNSLRPGPVTPAAVAKNAIARSHSAQGIFVSPTKAWRWRIRLSMISRRRGSSVVRKRASTSSRMAVCVSGPAGGKDASMSETSWKFIVLSRDDGDLSTLSHHALALRNRRLLRRLSRQSQLRGKVDALLGSPQPELLSEADALQLASRAFGDLGEEQDLPRRLVRREAFGQERAKLLLGGGQALA